MLALNEQSNGHGDVSSDRDAASPVGNASNEVSALYDAFNTVVTEAADKVKRAYDENPTLVVVGAGAAVALIIFALKGKSAPDNSARRIERQLRQFAAEHRRTGGDLADQISAVVSKMATVDPAALGAYGTMIQDWLSGARDQFGRFQAK